MKNRIWLVAAALALFAANAMSQGTILGWGQKNQQPQSATSPVVPQVKVNVVGGVFASDTSGVPLQFDASGNLRTSEYSKDRDLWRLYPNVINNFLTTNILAFADSNTIPIDTHDMKQLALVLYGSPDSLSSVVRLAVQVRGHYTTSSDSGSAFPWIRWPVRSSTVASGVDSIGHTLIGTYGVAQATTANVLASDGGLWPGEFEVKFNTVANDTSGAGNGKYGAYPKGMYIKLVDHGGDYFWAPYTSIRIRIINGVRSRFRIKADVVGRAL